jgi:PPIC-type PPIASE domain
MIGRGLFVCAVAGACMLAATGCGTTLSDAATVTYHDNRGTHTAHVDRAKLRDQLSILVHNKKFTAILAGQYDFTKPESVDPKVTQIWLNSRIQQAVIDAQFNALHLRVTPAMRAQARNNETVGDQAAGRPPKFISADVFNAFPKRFQDDIIEGEARLIALQQTCASGRVVYRILERTLNDAQAAFKQIAGGAQFTDVAKSKSLDTTTKAQGGLAGCLAPNDLPPEAQSTAEKVPFDTVTVPVKTQAGYFLLLVRSWDQKLASDPAFAPSLAGAASANLADAVTSTRTHVWVDPRFGTWEVPARAPAGTPKQLGLPFAPQVRNERDGVTTTTTAVPAGG